MNNPSTALLSSLSCGRNSYTRTEETSGGFVETLARVYEKARNALEYRADNLIRRAAIERILRRKILLNKNPKSLSENLLIELKWAKYLSIEEIKKVKRDDLERILAKYISYLNRGVPQEWVVKIASAEIEELINLNTDYKQFTLFAFQTIKQKIALNDDNLDLIIYFAVDKVYAGSDDEQVAYHILKLAKEPITQETFVEAWKLFNLAIHHKDLSRITKFVRRQMPPLILLRDIYFYEPDKFKDILANGEKFKVKAEEVLKVQLEQISGKIATAGVRSVIYVFLTKMILAIGVEVPFEIFFFGHLNKLPLLLNSIFSPFLMWIIIKQIHLPNKKEEASLVERTWYILQSFDQLKQEEDVLKDVVEERHNLAYWIFSVLYGVIFIGIFALIFFVLGKIGYSFFSKLIFVFFLTVISFFAYRISQIAKVYSWKDVGRERSSFVSIVSLPILAVGSRLSTGLSKLNFLAFAFDFILEAPFKLILSFVDDWFKFLSVKKEEQIIE